jgi:hypothetical protein
MGRLHKTIGEQMRRKPAMDHSMAGFGQCLTTEDERQPSAVGLPDCPRLECVSYGRMAAVGEEATEDRDAQVLAQHASRTIAQGNAGATRMEGVKVP